MKLRRPAREHPLVAAAFAYLGYTAKGGNQSIFGAETGTNGLHWDGAFIDIVTRDCGLLLPAHVYTASALAVYTRTGRLFRNPKVGDIVFFAFPAGTASELDAPHIGIVTDVNGWKMHRTFKTIEGQVSSNQPKGNGEHNGVYERVRHEMDIISFARPALRKRFDKGEGHESSATATNGVRVVTAHLSRCDTAAKSASATAAQRLSVETVQLALAETVGLREADRAVFNHKTVAALAAFQRSIGYINPTGTPDVRTLIELNNRSLTVNFSCKD